ncbi:MAG TPA: hypothetical protein VFN76_10010 [Candidatus Limnocylindria bacterium]|nr:hypothetical protein [Candidatus Limnocylindria bacterium]
MTTGQKRIAVLGAFLFVMTLLIAPHEYSGHAIAEGGRFVTERYYAPIWDASHPGRGAMLDVETRLRTGPIVVTWLGLAVAIGLGMVLTAPTRSSGTDANRRVD